MTRRGRGNGIETAIRMKEGGWDKVVRGGVKRLWLIAIKPSNCASRGGRGGVDHYTGVGSRLSYTYTSHPTRGQLLVRIKGGLG
jgi:hypothetical protein